MTEDDDHVSTLCQLDRFGCLPSIWHYRDLSPTRGSLLYWPLHCLEWCERAAASGFSASESEYFHLKYPHVFLVDDTFKMPLTYECIERMGDADIGEWTVNFMRLGMDERQSHFGFLTQADAVKAKLICL